MSFNILHTLESEFNIRQTLENAFRHSANTREWVSTSCKRKVAAVAVAVTVAVVVVMVVVVVVVVVVVQVPGIYQFEIRMRETSVP